MITTSRPAGGQGFWRTTSRTRRLMRFRTTALPTLLLTVMPIRPQDVSGALGATTAKNFPPWTARPVFCTARKSFRRRRRLFFGKRFPAAARSRPALPIRPFYFLAIVTETRLRPLARRRLNTARPDRVRIRVRNPWVRLRLLLWGWYVRFTTHTPDATGR